MRCLLLLVGGLLLTAQAAAGPWQDWDTLRPHRGQGPGDTDLGVKAPLGVPAPRRGRALLGPVAELDAVLPVPFAGRKGDGGVQHEVCECGKVRPGDRRKGRLGDSEDGRLLGEVRSLLIGTLPVDAPVSSSLTALRVHRVRDRESLVRLVWEVERSLVRARRPRESQARLSRARDLLGLGNTVVHEQTQPGYTGGD